MFRYLTLSHRRDQMGLFPKRPIRRSDSIPVGHSVCKCPKDLPPKRIGDLPAPALARSWRVPSPSPPQRRISAPHRSNSSRSYTRSSRSMQLILYKAPFARRSLPARCGQPMHQHRGRATRSGVRVFQDPPYLSVLRNNQDCCGVQQVVYFIRHKEQHAGRGGRKRHSRA